MRIVERLVPVLAVAAIAALASCGKQDEAKVEKAVDKVAVEAKAAAENAAKEVEAREIAIDAYIYAYPLVTMEYTRRVMGNTATPIGSKSPMGQFARLRNYPAVDDHSVTAPNADTLYTTAWLDLSKEPWILSIPDMKDRYFLFPMLDGWTNVFQVPGKRTTGTKAQKYAITGPGWTGTLPAGVTEYKAPTNLVWILGRIYCTGTPEDYKAVHALQDQVSVVPLSSYGKTYTPPPGKVDPSIDMKAGPRDQVNALDGATYFKLFADLMKANPPAADDAPMIAKLAKIGIVPGKDFDASKLDPAVAKGIAAAPKPGQEKISAYLKEALVTGDAKAENGWLFFKKTGLYGTGYRNRAMITWYGLGANRIEDAVYPTSEGPDLLKKYSGANKYVAHFNKGEMPPANAFLVDHDVRQGLLLRPQPDQPLHGELAQQVQDQCRRFGRPVRPERIAGQGQGAELAAGAQGRFRVDDAAVLAEGKPAVHPRWLVEATRGKASVIAPSTRSNMCTPAHGPVCTCPLVAAPYGSLGSRPCENPHAETALRESTSQIALYSTIVIVRGVRRPPKARCRGVFTHPRSGHDRRPAELTAAEQPLTVGRPEAAPRHRVQPTRCSRWLRSLPATRKTLHQPLRRPPVPVPS